MTTNTVGDTKNAVSQKEMIVAMVHQYLPLKHHLYWIIPLTIFIAAISILEPYVYFKIVDSIATGSGIGPELTFVAIWIALLVVSIYGDYFRDFKFHRILQKHWQIVVENAVEIFMTRTYAYHLRVNNSEKIKICNRAVDASYDVVHQLVLNIPKQLVVLIGYVGLALYMDWRLTLCVLLFIPVLAIFPLYVGSKAHSAQKSASTKWDAVYGRIGDAIMNIAVVLLFSRKQKIAKDVGDAVTEAAEQQAKVSIYWAMLEAGGQSIQAILSLVTLGISLYFYSKGFISIGELVLFLTIAGRITAPFLYLESSYRQISNSVAQYTKFYEVTKIPAEILSGSTDFPSNFESIVWKDVEFSYGSNDGSEGKIGEPVLKGLSFEIRKNSKVALVGHTGSGKSTLVQLLLRFYNPTSGTISLMTCQGNTVDSVDRQSDSITAGEISSPNGDDFTRSISKEIPISDIALDEYRKHFSAVFQDTTLFNRSLRDNLTFVRDSITDDMIKEACVKANIWDFIAGLPDQLDTLVGERGLKLSGGEKQRIAIARSILADPQILVLDEATSALDSQTEKHVTQALERLMEGRTSLVIAHRLSTIIRADSIILLEKGQIIAQGNHTYLYENEPKYREMVDLQRDGFVE